MENLIIDFKTINIEREPILTQMDMKISGEDKTIFSFIPSEVFELSANDLFNETKHPSAKIYAKEITTYTTSFATFGFIIERLLKNADLVEGEIIGIATREDFSEVLSNTVNFIIRNTKYLKDSKSAEYDYPSSKFKDDLHTLVAIYYSIKTSSETIKSRMARVERIIDEFEDNE